MPEYSDNNVYKLRPRKLVQYIIQPYNIETKDASSGTHLGDSYGKDGGGCYN